MQQQHHGHRSHTASANSITNPSAPAPPQASSRSTHDVILATAGYDHTIRFWEALNGMCYRTIQHPDSQVNRLAISPDRRYLAVAGNPTVRLYDALSAHNTPLASFTGHRGNVTGIAFSSEGTWMATSSEDGTLKVWDVRSPALQRNYEHHAPVNDVVSHPNQGEVVTCDQAGRVRVWDLGEEKCPTEMTPDEDVAIRSLAISPDCTTLVAGSQSADVFIWNLPSQTEMAKPAPIHRFVAHDNAYLTRLSVAQDQSTGSMHLATCASDATVKLWDLGRPDCPRQSTLRGHKRWVWDCAFSADSAYLVTASSDCTARLWELGTGETVRHYNGHNKAAVCVALNDLSVT